MLPPVHHNDADRRFEAETEAGTAVLAYSPSPGGVAFMHTRVPEGAQGKGVASSLAHAALEWARAEDLRVQPVCAFVAAYLRRHPEYADLVESSEE